MGVHITKLRWSVLILGVPLTPFWNLDPEGIAFATREFSRMEFEVSWGVRTQIRRQAHVDNVFWLPQKVGEIEKIPPPSGPESRNTSISNWVDYRYVVIENSCNRRFPSRACVLPHRYCTVGRFLLGQPLTTLRNLNSKHMNDACIVVVSSHYLDQSHSH